MPTVDGSRLNVCLEVALEGAAAGRDGGEVGAANKELEEVSNGPWAFPRRSVSSLRKRVFATLCL